MFDVNYSPRRTYIERMRLWFIALILALLGGCYSPAHATGVTTCPGACGVRPERSMTLVIDDSCDMDAVLAGIDAWSGTGLFEFAPVVEHAPRNHYASRGTIICSVHDAADLPPNAELYTGEIYLFDGWDSSTVAHELGHLIGLKHSTSPADLMYWAQTVDRPQAGDLAAFWALYR